MKPKESLETTRQFSIIKHNAEGAHNQVVDIVTERPFQILVNDDKLATVMATPNNLEEFLIGFLVGQGIISGMDQIERTLVEPEKGLLWAQVKNPVSIDLTKTLITSGCSGGISLDNYGDLLPLVKANLPDMGLVGKIMKEMLTSGDIYSRAGGVHSACLASKDGLIFQVEDIGRHNCLDKVIGFLVNEKLDPKDKLILTSGRLSIEAVVKTARAKIAVLGSRSTPTDLAVDLAKKLNIHIIGRIKTTQAIEF